MQSNMLDAVTLVGQIVRLEPLSLDHLGGLCAVGLEEDLWRWSTTPVRTRDDMRTYLNRALSEQSSGVSLPFATVLLDGQRVVGCTRYGNVDLANQRVEIGWTWVATAWQRTAVNTEAKLLMLEHAFETLGCVRVEFKTDALNTRSRAAIRRLGAIEEGTLRHHMITSTGRARDTVYFSILDDEWPEVRRRLRKKLGIV